VAYTHSNSRKHTTRKLQPALRVYPFKMYLVFQAARTDFRAIVTTIAPCCCRLLTVGEWTSGGS
jgi:thiaminase